MSRNAPLDEMVPCGNCQALNPPKSIVCLSCGVDLVGYQKRSEHLQEIKQQHASIHIVKLSEAATELAQSEIEQGRQRVAWLVRIALIVAVIIGLFAIAVASILGIQTRERNKRLANEFDQGKNCLAAQEYECARDTLIVLLKEEPHYPEAQSLLNDARYHLATKYVEKHEWLAAIDELEALDQELESGEQPYLGAAELLFTARYELAQHYAQAAQWQLAIDQLDALQSESPGNPKVLSTLEDIYDRWIAYAVSQGDLLTALRIKLQREARFPTKEK